MYIMLNFGCKRNFHDTHMYVLTASVEDFASVRIEGRYETSS